MQLSLTQNFYIKCLKEGGEIKEDEDGKITLYDANSIDNYIVDKDALYDLWKKGYIEPELNEKELFEYKLK